MKERTIKNKPNDFVKPCPKCGNNTEFNIHYKRTAGKQCELWAECKCGYDPTVDSQSERFENTKGATEKGIMSTLFIWNMAVEKLIERNY